MGTDRKPSRCYPFTLRCLCYDTSWICEIQSRPAMGWPRPPVAAAVPVRPTRAATRPLTSRRACRRVQADG